MVCENSSAPETPPTTVPTPTDVVTTVPTETATPQPTVTEDPNQTGGDCDVAYTQTQAWPGNFELNVTVTNNGSDPISGWDLVWELGAGEAFASGWNATFATDGQTITASNPSWDNNISADGESVSFGFQLTSDSDTLHLPTGFTLNGAACSGGVSTTEPTPTPTIGDGDCSVTYSEVTSWPGYVELNVTITNHSSSLIDGWELLWSLRENESYYHAWNAQVTQNGTQMSAVSPADWNYQIDPNGGVVMFGLQLATSDDVVQIPTEFTLNGSVCDVSNASEASPVPTPVIEHGDCVVSYHSVAIGLGLVRYAVEMTNNSDDTINDWELRWTVGDEQRYDQAWGARIVQLDNQIYAIASTPSDNQIAEGETVSFLIQISDMNESLLLPNDFRLNGTACTVTPHSGIVEQIEEPQLDVDPFPLEFYADGTATTRKANKSGINAGLEAITTGYLPNDSVRNIVSPLGLAFTIHTLPDVTISTDLALSVDYSGNGDEIGAIQDRLILREGIDCTFEEIDSQASYTVAEQNNQVDVVISLGNEADDAVSDAHAQVGNVSCRLWDEIPTINNDMESQTLTVDMSEVFATGRQRSSLYVLSTSAVGASGDFSQLPSNYVDYHETALNAGAYIYEYPIPVPPGYVGSVPQLSLTYNSALVDKINPAMNTQSVGAIGTGWSLNENYIRHHIQPCVSPDAENDFVVEGHEVADGDSRDVTLPDAICATDKYSIVWNGVRSKLRLFEELCGGD